MWSSAWASRYIRLESIALGSYAAEDAPAPKSQLMLSSDAVFAPCIQGPADKCPFRFRIQCKGSDPWVLAAQSAEERDAWLEALVAARDNCSAPDARAATCALHETNTAKVMQQLADFYKKHNPAKCEESNLRKTVTQFSGKEAELFAALKAKYSA